MANEERFYLLVCSGGTELCVHGGPYFEEKLLEAARHEKRHLCDQDNLFWLAASKNGRPRTGSFTNNELEEE